MLVSLLAGSAHAACNLIPQAQKTFRGALGTVDRPFAAPGDLVEIGVRSAVCDATSPGLTTDLSTQVVTLVFTPLNNGPRRVVVITPEDCNSAAVQAKLSTCGATSGVTSVSCQSLNHTAVTRNGQHRLVFRFPNTDSLFAPAFDQRTLSGPVSIAVSNTSQPLPCGLATQPCTSQTSLTACIDELYELNGSCDHSPNPVFSRFLALPPPNDFQANCFRDSPPCTALGTELRGTLDAEGNVLLPMNWQGILVRNADVPVPRLLRETIKTPVGMHIPAAVYLGSFTPEGGKLPPIFTPQFDPSVLDPNILTMFGSADAASTVLRIARHRGRCSSGRYAGQECAASTDCLGATCADACNGGSNDGAICTGDIDCPGGACGRLFDDTLFRAVTTNGGPLVVPRNLPQMCQLDPHESCSSSAECSGAQNACVAYALEAENPVPLEGLTGSSDLFSFVSNEAIDLRDHNGDGDTVDQVVTLRDKVSGLTQPLGAPAACGIGGTPEGRAVESISEPPFRFPAVASEGDTLAFLESEANQNFCDENGDTNFNDSLLRVFRLDHGEVTAGLSTPRAVDATPLIDDRNVVVSNGKVFYRRSETSQGRKVTERANLAGGYAQASPYTVGAPQPSSVQFSQDGRYVQFFSGSSNLNSFGYGVQYVYVRDRLLGITELQSVSSLGSSSGIATDNGRISRNGRFVTFSTPSFNLIPGDSFGHSAQILLRDRQTGTIERISESTAGGPSNSQSNTSSLSADGNTIAFDSYATDLIPGGTGCCHLQVFVRDRTQGTTELVSVAANGLGVGNSGAWRPQISADGRFVAFSSYASDLIPGGTTTPGVFVRDRCRSNGATVPGCTAKTELVSMASSDPSGVSPDVYNNNVASVSGISADGRFVVFVTQASNLVPADAFNSRWDVFVRDRLLRTTEMVSVSTEGVLGNGDSGSSMDSDYVTNTISDDGRFVVFESDATNLVPDDTNGQRDVFVRDRLKGTTQKVSISTTGGAADAGTGVPTISPDGRVVAFPSGATNLVANDTNANDDIFVRGVDVSDSANDVTGDNDLQDTVLESITATSAAVSTLCPADTVSVAAGAAAFLRPESAGSTPNLPGCPSGTLVAGKPDLNANGASSDEVVHFAPASGAVQNLGVAATDVSLSGTCSGGNTPGQMCTADVDCSGGTCGASWIAALVSEAAQNAILNNDGDMSDTVVEVHSAGSGSWLNTLEAADAVHVCGSVVVFTTPESAQGADRNGDMDSNDRVLQIYNPSTQTLINTHQAAEEFVCGPGLVAFRTSEAAQGNAHLNADLDTTDFVLQVYDVSRAACVSASPPADCLRNSFDTVRPCRLDACDPRQPYRVLPDLVRFLTYECDEGGDVTAGCSGGGRDLNGDVPPYAGNIVLQVFQFSTGVTRVLGKIPGGAASDGTVYGTGNPLGSGSTNPGTSNDAFTGVVYNAVGRCIEDLGNYCASSAYCDAGAFCEDNHCKREQRVCVNDSDCTGVPCRKTGDAAIVPASPDTDGDGIPDHIDNCPLIANADQADQDTDGVGDACDAAPCGDGIRQPSESCDSNDDASCPGLCRANCKCPVCGDYQRDASEECDGTDNSACNGLSCLSDCTCLRCGNGIVESGEQCDDGNSDSHDSCKADCTLNVCGDQVVGPGEQCDGTDSAACSGGPCQIDCNCTLCGNGLGEVGEQCDDGNGDNHDNCKNDCTFNVCGDQVVGPGEQCDGTDDAACNGSSCLSNCNCARCGNGIVESGEACDDGNSNNQDACKNDCMPSVCGDGVRNLTLQHGTVPFQYIDISAVGTPLSLNDDQVSGPLPLGFPFNFYGNTFTQVYVSSNGFIGFNPGMRNGCCSGSNFPQLDNPGYNVIAGFWTDLNPGVGGSYSYAQVGDVFVLQSTAVPLYNGSGTVSLQYQLYADGHVEIHYLDVRPGSQVVTAGIENSDGSLSYQHYFGIGDLVNFAVAYKPLEQCDGADAATCAGFPCSDSCTCAPPTPTPTATPTQTPTTTPTLAAGCPAQPATGCLSPGNSSISIKSDPNSSKSKLSWKWSKGTLAAAQSAFGDPVMGNPQYKLCLYDQTSGTSVFKMGAMVAAGGTCGSRPCWKAASDKGWSYKNRDANGDGITKVKFKGGDAGKPGLQVGGKGSHLALPNPVSSSKFFNQDTQLIVQFHASEPVTCWSSAFATNKNNNGSSFKGVSP